MLSFVTGFQKKKLLVYSILIVVNRLIEKKDLKGVIQKTGIFLSQMFFNHLPVSNFDVFKIQQSRIIAGRLLYIFRF